MAEDTEKRIDWEKLVVRVFVKNEDGSESYKGTAFLIDTQHLLTARHVVEEGRKAFDSDSNKIILRNGPWTGDRFLKKAPIPHSDQKIDIALLQLRTPNSKVLEYWPIMEVSALKEKIVKIAGFDDKEIDASAPEFHVLGENSKFYSVELQNKVQHGKSGGPVILNNQLVGIVYARTDTSESQKDQNKTYIYPYCAFKDFLFENGINLSNQKASGTRLDLGAKELIDYKALKPDERAAFIDREEQWDKHILQRLKKEKERRTFAFVVAGVDEEWPDSLKFRLLIHQNIKTPFPIHSLDLQDSNPDQWEHDFLSLLIDQIPTLQQYQIEDMDTADLKALFKTELTVSENPSLFHCFLKSGTSKNIQLLNYITTLWESLDLIDAKKRHFLLIVYGHEKRGKGLSALIKRGEQKVEVWRQALAESLSEKQAPKIVAPKLDSPNKDHVLHWSRTYLEGKEQTNFDKAINQLKGKQIPHRTLKDIYNGIK